MGRPAAQAIIDTTNHTLGIGWAFGHPSGGPLDCLASETKPIRGISYPKGEMRFPPAGSGELTTAKGVLKRSLECFSPATTPHS